MADRLLAGEPFRRSENGYDWLGSGVYFWEYGPDRALQFAREKQQRGQIVEAAAIGALVQLGRCLDLLDTGCTLNLAEAYPSIAVQYGTMLPRNVGTCAHATA
jgi:hypothetical protein